MRIVQCISKIRTEFVLTLSQTCLWVWVSIEWWPKRTQQYSAPAVINVMDQLSTMKAPWAQEIVGGRNQVLQWYHSKSTIYLEKSKESRQQWQWLNKVPLGKNQLWSKGYEYMNAKRSQIVSNLFGFFFTEAGVVSTCIIDCERIKKNSNEFHACISKVVSAFQIEYCLSWSWSYNGQQGLWYE